MCTQGQPRPRGNRSLSVRSGCTSDAGLLSWQGDGLNGSLRCGGVFVWMWPPSQTSCMSISDIMGTSGLW